jgi:hypothetical protein
MGDPTEPGEDQEATVVIEGPPANADPPTKAEYDADFTKFKAEVRQLYKRYPRLRIRLRRVTYVKKEER